MVQQLPRSLSPSVRSKMTANESMNLEKFTDLIFLLLKEAWGKEWGVFTDSHPTIQLKNIVLPQIVYELGLMKPGLVGKNTREIKPRHREILTVSENGEEKYLKQKGQVFDLTYRFYVYGTSNIEAEKTALNFMDLLSLYTGYLKSKGLKEIVFSGLEKLKEESSTKEVFSTYLVQYQIQLESFTEEFIPEINAILVNVETAYEKMHREGELPSQA